MLLHLPVLIFETGKKWVKIQLRLSTFASGIPVLNNSKSKTVIKQPEVHGYLRGVLRKCIMSRTISNVYALGYWPATSYDRVNFVYWTTRARRDRSMNCWLAWWVKMRKKQRTLLLLTTTNSHYCDSSLWFRRTPKCSFIISCFLEFLIFISFYKVSS